MFDSLDFVAGSCCRASSDSSVAAPQAAEENCPCYSRILEYSELQVSVVCEVRFHHRDFAWHVERLGAAVTYVGGGLSLAEVDAVQRTGTVNYCCSGRLGGIEKCP